MLVVTTFGEDNTLPAYLQSPLNCLYGWLACIALMGWFAARFDRIPFLRWCIFGEKKPRA